MPVCDKTARGRPYRTTSDGRYYPDRCTRDMRFRTALIPKEVRGVDDQPLYVDAEGRH